MNKGINERLDKELGSILDRNAKSPPIGEPPAIFCISFV